MPFETFENLPTPSPKEQVFRGGEGEENLAAKTPELQEFTPEEIEEVLERIINRAYDAYDAFAEIPPGVLGKINKGNIDVILNLAVERLSKESQSINRGKLKDLKMGWEAVWGSASGPHILLCAVNGKEDFKFFGELIEKFAQNEGKEPTDKRIRYLKETVSRHVELEEISEQLLKIDIKRRIGTVKEDDSLFLGSIPQLEITVQKIAAVLDYFGQKEIQLKPPESEKIKGLIDKIQDILDRIKDKDIKSIEGRFYEFCLDIGHLVAFHFDVLNKKQMQQAIEELTKP